MNLVLERDIKTPQFTLGCLYAVGKKLAFSCEDTVRGDADPATVMDWKIDGTSAIPSGTYRVIVDFSPHFQKALPHILNVPGFEGVRFHGGNDATATEGCVLLGITRTNNGVKNCAPAVNALIDLIQKSTSEVYVTIS